MRITKQQKVEVKESSSVRVRRVGPRLLRNNETSLIRHMEESSEKGNET